MSYLTSSRALDASAKAACPILARIWCDALRRPPSRPQKLARIHVPRGHGWGSAPSRATCDPDSGDKPPRSIVNQGAREGALRNPSPGLCPGNVGCASAFAAAKAAAITIRATLRRPPSRSQNVRDFTFPGQSPGPGLGQRAFARNM